MAFTPITLTGTYNAPNGGGVQFLPSGVMTQGGGLIEPTIMQQVTLASSTSAALSIVLPATNDPATLPLNVSYQVTELIVGAAPNIYNILLPYNANGGTIDITQCIRVLPTAYPNQNVILAYELGKPFGPASLDQTGSLPVSEYGNLLAALEALAGAPTLSALATVQYAPVTLVGYALTATLTAIDTSNLTIPLIVPASGKIDVAVQIAGQITSDGSSGGVIGFGLFIHGTSTQLGYTIHPLGWGVDAVGSPISTYQCRFHLIGLTPGVLQIDLAAACTGGTTGELSAQGYTGNPNASNSSPALLQAFQA